MIHLITGNNFKKIQSHITSLVDLNTSLVQMDVEDFSESKFNETIVSQGLFGQKTALILRDVLQDKANEAFIFEHLKEMKDSSTIFVILEKKFLKKASDKIAKHAEVVKDFMEREVAKSHDFNIFSLADAVGRRDKKMAWILLQKAFASNIPPENVYGTLLWQIKAMLLVQNAYEDGIGTAKLGLKPYVAQKALGFSKNYTKKEIQGLLSGLIDAYHRARAGQEELNIGLERLVLKL